MSFQDEGDEVIFSEPILAKKGCKLEVVFVEPVIWTVKDTVPGHEREQKKACKITLAIVDDMIETEHPNAKPRLIMDDQFNLERYPYVDKKTGTVRFMARNKLFQLEDAFGFDPVYKDKEGNLLEPKITRAGNKVAPKVEGATRFLNPSFAQSYFQEDGTVNPTNWIGKVIYADVDVELNEKFGDKNTVSRYVKAPLV